MNYVAVIPLSGSLNTLTSLFFRPQAEKHPDVSGE
jgi:hypothetical protein